MRLGAQDCHLVADSKVSAVYGADTIVERHRHRYEVNNNLRPLIEKAGLGSWGLLFLLMGMTFMLGFFLDWVEITLIILPIFAPLVVLLDFGDHVSQLTGLDGRKETMVWFLVLMAINLQTSFLTPPFGFALFYLKGVAPPEVATLSIYKGVIPFVIIQLIGLSFPAGLQK